MSLLESAPPKCEALFFNMQILFPQLREQDWKAFFQSANLATPIGGARLQTCFLPQQKHFSPVALFYVDLWSLFAGVFGVIVLLFIIRVQIFGDFPEFLRAQLERPVLLRLVPEDLLLQFVGFRIVIDHQALKILGALVHHLAEALKCGEHARVVLVDAFAIGNVGLAQDKHVINVRAQIGRNAERILHCDD